MLSTALGLGCLAALSVMVLPVRSAASAGAEQEGVERDDRQVHVGLPGGRVRGPWWRRRGAGGDADAIALSVLDDLTAGVEAGLPVSRAVSLALGQHRSRGLGLHAWSVLAQTAADGQELAPAWARVARATRSPALSSVARAWRVASLTGAPLSDALRVSAETARERLRLERSVDAATAGARATATVLTLLPLAGLVLAAVLGVGPATLYGSPVAWASLGTGAVLLLVGQVLVRTLVERVLQGVR